GAGAHLVALRFEPKQFLECSPDAGAVVPDQAAVVEHLRAGQVLGERDEIGGAVGEDLRFDGLHDFEGARLAARHGAGVEGAGDPAPLRGCLHGEAGAVDRPRLLRGSRAKPEFAGGGIVGEDRREAKGGGDAGHVLEQTLPGGFQGGHEVEGADDVPRGRLLGVTGEQEGGEDGDPAHGGHSTIRARSARPDGRGDPMRLNLWGEVRWFARAFARKFSADSTMDSAASLAFFAILAFFPFLIGMVSLASLLMNPRTVEVLLADLAEIAPPDVTRLVGGQ